MGQWFSTAKWLFTGQWLSMEPQGEPEDEDIKQIRIKDKEGGPDAVLQYVQDELGKWEDEIVKIGITGRSATGKSSFINAIRGVKPGDKHFAQTGSGDTTFDEKLYSHPANDKIQLYDLPGVGSLRFKKEWYIKKMQGYNFVFIFFENVFSEDDLWVAEELNKMGKPFCFVRSKIDRDLENAEEDGKSECLLISQLKEKAIKTMKKHPELQKSEKIFFISSRNMNYGDTKNMLEYLDRNLAPKKYESLVNSFSNSSKPINEKKASTLEKRAVKATVLCCLVTNLTGQYVDIGINCIMLYYEITHYINVFGLTKEKMKTITGLDEKMLRCRSWGFYKKSLEVAVPEIMSSIEKMVPKSAYDQFKFILNLLSPKAKHEIAYKYLCDRIDDLKADAILVHDHVMNQASCKYT